MTALPLYDEALAADLATMVAASLPLTARPAGACLWCKRTERPVVGFYVSLRSMVDSGDPVRYAEESMRRWLA